VGDIGAPAAAGLIPISDGTGGWAWGPQSGGGGSKLVLRASNQGNVSSTIGALQLFNVTPGNPGGVIEQTQPSTGINNGGIAPWYFPACTLVKAGLAYSGAAVAQATTGGAMRARFELFKSLNSTRTLVSMLDFPVSNAGVFNNSSGNNFTTGITLATSVAISEGDLLGLQFTNQGSNNDEINAIRACYVYLEFDL